MARYLYGSASAEEEAVVFDYAAASEEHLADLLTMAAAIELSARGQTRWTASRMRRRWPSVAAAAAVALIVGVGIALNARVGSGSPMATDPAPAYAVQDSIAAIDEEGKL